MTIRRQFITDCVESYIKNNVDDYRKFLAQIATRRMHLDDKKFAKLAGEKEMRVCVSIPDKLLNMFGQGLDGVDEKRFFEVKGEEKWFIKKFPQFLVPNEY